MREEWVETTLGKVADWSAGGTPAATNASFYSDGTIPWAVIADVRNCPLAKTARQITEDGLKALGGAKKMAPAGSVLLTMYGSVGRSAIACIPMATNQAIAWAVPDESKISSEYLFCFLRSKESQFDALARGATQRNINKGIVTGFPISVPPLAEQQRIVDLIGSLDDAIEAANENAAHATNARFALSARSFALMSAGRTVPLSEIAETRLGKMLSANVNKGTPAKYVRNADVQWNSINLTGLKSMPFSDGDRDEYSIKRGDVLICEGGEIGRSSVVLDDLDNIYFQKAIHRVRCGETLIPEFLQAYMHHLAFSGGLENFSGGTTIPHLTGVNLRQLPMPVVPIADQRALVTILDALNSNSSSLVAYAASLRHLRTNLLTSLLSGAHEIPESYNDLLTEAV